MTDNLSALADFFAAPDIDSLRALGLANHGIDITGVYCLHTGRRVGTFDDFVIQFAVEEEATDSEELLVDALVTRCVASMRPSPMLNKPDRITLLNLAMKFPVDVLSYLVNRLHSSRYSAVHRPSDESILSPYLARIKTHQRWTDLALKGVDTRAWIHWLLELDAKRNLHDIKPAQVAKDLKGKWIEVAIGESLFDLITVDNQAELLAIFERWAIARIAEYEARDREAVAQDKWFRGNSMTQPAYVRSWMENPEFANKKSEQLFKVKNGLVKARPVAEKTRKLNEKVSQFLNLLDDIIDAGAETVTPAKAKPAVMTGAMLFRKKESI